LTGGTGIVFNPKENNYKKPLPHLSENIGKPGTALNKQLNIEPGLTETERLQHERDHYRILVEITNAVISRQNPGELIEDISGTVRHFFGTEYLSLDLFDAEGQTLRIHAACYQADGSCVFSRSLVAREQSIAANAFVSRTTRLANRHEIELLAQVCPQARILANRGAQSACALPLIAGQRMLGALNLGHLEREAFSAYHLAILQEIAARIAIGMENSMAYEEISRLKDRLANENLYLTEEIKNFGSFGEIIGDSPAIREVMEQVEMVANSDCTVLILGETGTGKEVFARTIHNISDRKNATMVKVNCAAIPANLLESDLFGHEKGAFTGATSQRVGRFELADKGTLFLDEVGDIPLELQPKLLRALQEREIERVGSHRVIPVDIRLIAATNRDLPSMIADREFRSDLYYRLNVFPIMLPPLRERRDDIPKLVHHFVDKFARRMNRQIDAIPEETLDALKRLPWPGNVRELENVIERAVILTRGHVLNLPSEELRHHQALVTAAPIMTPATPVEKAPVPEPPQLADASEAERQKIIRILQETNGIVAGPRGAAARLGLKRTTLLSRMQRLGISSRDISIPPGTDE
jgi:formate hydrogenlyase transcriptional activator